MTDDKKAEGTLPEDLQFAGFIASLATGAFQHMGKIANPMTGKVERDLDAAKATIDVLVMLQKKTKGNLSPEEQSLMDNYVTNLQLNYVEESKIQKTEQPADKREQTQETKEPGKEEKESVKEDKSDSKVKWSKTYSEEDKK